MASISVFRTGPILPAVCRQVRAQARCCWSKTQAAPYSTSHSVKPRVAVLYQALDPPIIDGIRKPKKPNGYQDSGADIAYNLKQEKSLDVITPIVNPNPTKDDDWTFPDTEDGILEAIDRGATHLWANTIVFASHPLQTSAQIGQHAKKLRVVGQSPLCVDRYDNKDWVNTLLRKTGGFTMPRSWGLPAGPSPGADAFRDLPFPVVAKPIRGRGSHGVKVCRSPEELAAHAKSLADENAAVMLEEFLQGEEATVTVMPPTADKGYWALPLVSRFNHHDGIAPYNGVVAVTANSRVVPDCERDPICARVMRESERAAELLGVTAPIRIDVRRYSDSPDSDFALFDVNMKPNMTGPGRPGRDDQASLTMMAASALGWDYKELLRQILATSSTLATLRELKPKEIPRSTQIAYGILVLSTSERGINPVKFPLDPDRDYTPKAATVANATDFETSLGIDHACIVLPSIYGTNNSILIDALRQFNGSYRGVAVIDPDNITNETLAMFQDAGVRGLRVNLDSENSTEVSEVVYKNTAVAKQMNWVLQLYTPLSSLTYLHDFIVDSGVTFAFDHFGHTLVGSKTNVSMNTYDPYRTPGFRELIDLVQKKIMFVKISGPYRDSNQAPLYEDMRVVAETLINAGPDMVVYGSDWPHTPVGAGLQVQDFQDINDAALVEITKDWAGSESQIHRLFVDNPRRLWQWYEDS